jgi:hypothetical protein
MVEGPRSVPPPGRPRRFHAAQRIHFLRDRARGGPGFRRVVPGAAPPADHETNLVVERPQAVLIANLGRTRDLECMKQLVTQRVGRRLGVALDETSGLHEEGRKSARQKPIHASSLPWVMPPIRARRSSLGSGATAGC